MPQAGDGSAAYTAANQAVAQLSAAALAKLLKVAHDAAGSGSPSTAGSSSSRHSILTQSCQPIVYVLTEVVYSPAEVECLRQEMGTAGATAGVTSSQPGSEVSTSRLPVPPGECCKLLQDAIRLVAAAAATAAAAAPAAARSAAAAGAPSTGLEALSRLLGWVGSLLGWVDYEPGIALQGVSGPLVTVTRLVAAGVVSSPVVLQLFGLLCSLLKVCSVGSISSGLLSHTPVDMSQQKSEEGVSTAVLVAV
jgi:hypothetical protein